MKSKASIALAISVALCSVVARTSYSQDRGGRSEHSQGIIPKNTGAAPPNRTDSVAKRPQIDLQEELAAKFDRYRRLFEDRKIADASEANAFKKRLLKDSIGRSDCINARTSGGRTIYSNPGWALSHIIERAGGAFTHHVSSSENEGEREPYSPYRRGDDLIKFYQDQLRRENVTDNRALYSEDNPFQNGSIRFFRKWQSPKTRQIFLDQAEFRPVGEAGYTIRIEYENENEKSVWFCF